MLDAGAQDAQALRLLGQGGQDMHDVAEMLRRSVRALDDAQAASRAVTDRMVGDLNAVAGAFTLDLRTGGLQSDRPQFVSRAVEIVKAAAAEIRRITETYDGVLTRDGAQLAGRGYAGAPVAPGDRFSPEAARRDAERLRAALADPDAKDVLLDDATTTLQALDAQVRSGHPLTAEQQRYITDFANIAGTDALVALPGLADTGVQQGADRAEAAVAGTLSALTNPELGGTADVGALPAVLRTLTDDPLSAVDDPGRRTDLVHQLEALPRYEGVNQLLGATSVPLGDQFSVTAGQQAIKTSQLTAQVLDRQHFPLPLGFNTDAFRPELEAAARGSSLQLTNVSRNLDAAQTLLQDADTRKSLLVTPHVDATGAADAARAGDGAGRARRRYGPGRRGRGRGGREGERPGRRRGAHRRRAGPVRLARGDRQGHAGQRRDHRHRGRQHRRVRPQQRRRRRRLHARPGFPRASTAGSAWAGRTRRTCSRSSGRAAPPTVPTPTSSGCTWPPSSSPSTRSRRRRSARRTPARPSARPAA